MKYTKKPKKIKKKKNTNIFKVEGMFKFYPLAINLLLPLLGGAIIGFLNQTSTYELLAKPWFSPPAIVFKIIWPILYILMGIAAYRIYIKNKLGYDDKGAYFSYLLQLMFNFMWSFIFFTFRLYGIAFIWSVILFILIINTFIKFIKIDKLAGILLTPYIAWSIVAQVLACFIWILNEM